jgi:hypothetical protein
MTTDVTEMNSVKAVIVDTGWHKFWLKLIITQLSDLRFEVFTAVKVQIMVFWVVTPYSSDVVGCRCSEDLAASVFRRPGLELCGLSICIIVTSM